MIRKPRYKPWRDFYFHIKVGHIDMVSYIMTLTGVMKNQV